MTRFVDRGLESHVNPSVRRAVALVVLMSCVSCGPPAAPDRGALPPPLAIGSAAPQKPPTPPRPEAPPRAPDDLGLIVRINDPEQLAREVVSILPTGASSGAALLDPTQLLVAIIGRRLANIVDLAQPLDMAMVGAGPSLVMSMAVKQEAEATLRRSFVLKEEGGLVHIGPLEGQPEDADRGNGDHGSTCVFVPGTGRVVTRLVCSSDEAAVAPAALYLARGVAAEPLDADARVRVPGKVLRDKKDPTTQALGDVATARLGHAIVDTFLEEVEHVDVDLRFLGPRVEMALDLRLGVRTSILSKVVVTGSKAAAPPRAFYRLPADALIALHTTGALAEDISPLRKTLAESLEGTLVEDGYARDKTHALRERFESLLMTGGPLVFAAGVGGGRDGANIALAAVSTLDGAHSKQDEARTLAQARTALTPWLMFEVEEAPTLWTQGLRDLIQRALDADRTRAAHATSTTPRDPDGDHLDLRVGTLDPALKLPKDTLHLEVSITPRTKGKRPARKGHFFVVPKGSATWMGYSEDAAAIAARLRLAVDDATEVGTLGRSPEAASLRARLGVAAGLVSLAGVGHFFATTTTLAELSGAARRAAHMTALGVQASDIVTWTLTADTTPGAVHTTLRADATRATSAAIVRALDL